MTEVARSGRLADLWAAAEDDQAPVSFALVVKARRQRLVEGLADEARQVERLLTDRFEESHGRILKSYFGLRAYAGCALTEAAKPEHPPRALHTLLNSTSDRLLSMETRCEILSQDAVTVFTGERLRSQLAISTDAVYGVMTRVLAAAELLAPGSPARPEERRAALVAARRQVQLVTERVSLLIQRQARYGYLIGVLWGALAALLVAGALGLLATRYWSGVLDPPAFAAAAVFGSLGSVVSVFQRISTGRLLLDYSAPGPQRLLLGCLRPFVGLVSGMVVHFALLAGLTTGQSGSTSVAFAATIGFAAGFSERLLTDMVERAGRLLTGAAPGGPDPAAPATGGGDVNADIVAEIRDEEVSPA